MKILICGSRSFKDYDAMCNVLSEYDISEIISGGARGADLLAATYAVSNDIELTELIPDWYKEGKAAGVIRNVKMLDLKPDLVIAFWDGVSKGTKHTIDLAEKKNIATLIIEY